MGGEEKTDGSSDDSDLVMKRRADSVSRSLPLSAHSPPRLSDRWREARTATDTHLSFVSSLPVTCQSRV